MAAIDRPLISDRHSLRANIEQQLQVWYALMMHDIKARFFGNGLGYIVTIAWPLGHMVLIIVLNAGRIAPHGSSMLLYAATAVVPFVAANYIARFIMMGVMMNRAFLQYPVIKPLDLMISRAFLELINNYIVVAILLVFLVIMGVDPTPIDITQAAAAWGASILLGLGIGFLNGVIVMVFPLWNVIFIAFIIAAWTTCGITIDPEVLPAPYGYYLSFNPVMHAVEWLRLAYYPDFRAHLLDKNYLIEFAIFCFCLGLVIEKVMRAELIQSR